MEAFFGPKLSREEIEHRHQEEHGRGLRMQRERKLQEEERQQKSIDGEEEEEEEDKRAADRSEGYERSRSGRQRRPPQPIGSFGVEFRY